MSKGGRPRKVIDWATVDRLCGFQATEEEIAQFCGVSVSTLDRACKREHRMGFDDYFDQKRGTGRISLRRAQWQAAMKGNPTMLIWLGKQYLEQRDKSSHEHSGPNGKPIETRDLSQLTDEGLTERVKGLIQQHPKLASMLNDAVTALSPPIEAKTVLPEEAPE